MKHLFVAIALLLGPFAVLCQSAQRPFVGTPNPALAPFYHGVASGSPTANGVVLWTRIGADSLTGAVPVTCTVAKDTAFQQVVWTGNVAALPERDYTVNVAVTGLQPYTTYYYYFEALGRNSLIGRAKTSPNAAATDHLRFGVVSCANYQSGYFGAYGHLAERNDLDAVLHLGDYIYEYGAYSTLADRFHEPIHEILTLADYRTRYALYRLDPNLIRLHQQHTVISVWDDHESANDSYTDGADNHQASEGSWAVRKAIAKQVYFEWMPVPEDTSFRIYQHYPYGDLCDIWMLDTRLEGRDKPPAHFDTPEPSVRHIISDTQEQWLLEGLKTSGARWKVIGNQVLFSTFNVGFAAGILDGNPDPTNIDSIRVVEDAFIDNWESYPTQRNRIIDSLQAHAIDNVVFVSGDSHCSWAFDVTKAAVLYPLAVNLNLPQINPYNPNTGQGYDKTTGNGSHAVEFGTPSISSSNFDELVGLDRANQFEAVMGAPIPPFNLEYNPHLKYVDLDRHGYILLDLRPDTAQANYYYINSPLINEVSGSFGQGAFTVHGDNRVLLRNTASLPKSVQDIPAPLNPLGTVGTNNPPPTNAIMGVQPNPAQALAFIQLIMPHAATLHFTLVDAQGRVVQQLPAVDLSAGLHLYPLQLSDLPSGVYRVVAQDRRGGVVGSRLVVKR